MPLLSPAHRPLQDRQTGSCDHPHPCQTRTKASPADAPVRVSRGVVVSLASLAEVKLGGGGHPATLHVLPAMPQPAGGKGTQFLHHDPRLFTLPTGKDGAKPPPSSLHTGLAPFAMASIFIHISLKIIGFFSS